MLGFGEGRTENGVFCGGTFLSGERKVPPHPLQRKPLLRGLPRGERVRPHMERMRQETRNGERGVFAGEPFFLGKERFPRTPSKESRFYAVCPAEGGSGRGARAPAPPSVGRTRVPGFIGERACGAFFLVK